MYEKVENSERKTTKVQKSAKRTKNKAARLEISGTIGADVVLIHAMLVQSTVSRAVRKLETLSYARIGSVIWFQSALTREENQVSDGGIHIPVVSHPTGRTGHGWVIIRSAWRVLPATTVGGSSVSNGATIKDPNGTSPNTSSYIRVNAFFKPRSTRQSQSNVWRTVLS